MGTVSGRTGTKTEVSAGTFVELFGAVVTVVTDARVVPTRAGGGKGTTFCR